MFKSLKQISFLVIALILSTITLTSCGSNEAQTRYVAVKLVDSDMWSIVDVNSGEVIHKDEFKSQPSIIVNDKFCVKNESGLYDYFSVDNVTKPINEESYLCASSFSNNDVALVVLKGKGISLINDKCEIIANIDNSIISANVFTNGYSVVTNDDNKQGYINEKGELVINPIYDSATNFSSDGLAVVGKEINDSTTKYSAIDITGTELFSFSSTQYKKIGSFVNGYLPVKKDNDEVVLLDKNGNKFVSIGKWKGSYLPYWLGFYDGVIVFKDGDSFGLKDEKGDIVIRAKYEELIPLSEINSKYYLAMKQDKYGIIDKDDNIIIPFEYKVLGYLNKETLFVGEGKMFSFMNKDLKDVGQNNFTNLSFITGSSIRSNYFNADKEARKIISHITDSSFFKTHKGMVLRDFKNKLSGYKYADMDQSTITDYDYPYMLLYAFDQHLSSQRYEYIYGYRFPKSPEYNYNANLVAVSAISASFSDFQPGSEVALGEAFDNLIQKQGFKPVDGKSYWYKNDSGFAVGLGYNDNVVEIKAAYNPHFMLEIERNPRSNDDSNVQVDYVDTFGLECDSVAVDSTVVEVVEEAVVEE